MVYRVSSESKMRHEYLKLETLLCSTL
ncbi:hypothetical protein B4U80_05949 [Leptotrombidium deliense]|uniref:Uncharacterized protein n=1 Tax=Leptotrombidium deliense TaxID=299467 RepID=A0A443R5Q6_9ACAR|nr:hypothetical protein B4U80_05949 [Leptotrombidium deliense]